MSSEQAQNGVRHEVIIHAPSVAEMWQNWGRSNTDEMATPSGRPQEQPSAGS